MTCSNIHVHTNLIYIELTKKQWNLVNIQLIIQIDGENGIFGQTFALRPYLVVMLRNGTIVIVNTVPHNIPPIKQHMLHYERLNWS